ncbi:MULTISPECIES: flavodoxin family protein [unclassified Enterococcus]|uniref:flavodoxin family protein n=1 Tax=unclassified Enterococcus TaxID=2608891 RepID=UPI001A9B3C8C|nr:flavodoxin [Enterococcus sp. DIV1271a]MBO1300104.1 flavodoxin [Enterococcus sp. DIV1271a]
MPIVVYFSHRGEHLINGKIQSIQVGNTETVAYKISRQLECPCVEIVPVTAYPQKYTELLVKIEAEKKLNDLNDRGAIYPLEKDIASAYSIFLGYPNWLGTLPKPIVSFLQETDLANKLIYPFCTHEGSGFGRSLLDLKILAPASTIKTGLPIRGSRVLRSDKAIENWLIQFYESNNRQEDLKHAKTNSWT